MPQSDVPSACLAVRPVNPSGVQEQISLGAGNLVVVGNPGGPVVFANFGAMIVPALYGGFPRSVTGRNA